MTNYYELKVFAYYGKADGEETKCEEVFTSIEELEDFLNAEWSIDSSTDFDIGSYESLINEQEFCSEANHGGDWDDPTSFGYLVSIISYEKELEMLKSKFEQDKKNLIKKYDKLKGKTQ